MAILKRKHWRTHSNPWSGWTRIAIAPFLYVSIWYHNWYALALVILWAIINPFVFPRPKSTNNWASKGVLGEELWTEKLRWDFSLFLNVVAGLFAIPSLYFAYVNLFWPVLYCASVAFLAKMWFADRMVFYYERNKED